MNDSLVSVIVPVYNVEKYLSKCIDSILGQSYDNIEVICINDGSTDNSLYILRDYEQKDTRIKIIDIQNKGVSNARNVGIDRANGEWISFVDADDYLEKNCIETLIECAKESGADIIAADYYTERNNLRKKMNFYKKNFTDTKSEVLRRIFTTGAVVWDKLYKKNVFNNIRFNPEFKIGEDGLVLCEALSKFTCAFTDEALYTYVIRNNSATTSSFDSRVFNGLMSTSIINERMLAFDAQLKDVTMYRVQRMMLYSLISKLNVADSYEIEKYSKYIKDAKIILKKNYNIFKKNKYISLREHFNLARFLFF